MLVLDHVTSDGIYMCVCVCVCIYIYIYIYIYIQSDFYIINIYYYIIIFHFIENVQQVKNIIFQKEKPNTILHHKKKSLALPSLQEKSANQKWGCFLLKREFLFS